ncbi:MAG: cysteine desulfurase [Elusimicrobia bacterium]|nr:cysteine desulfurase [Elusimicrobiota bacterium]
MGGLMDLEGIRADFPILKRLVHGKPLIYLDNAATTQKPRSVIDALSRFYENHNANIHRGVHTLSDEATQLVEEARAKTAAFIGASKPQTIVFTRNATEAINLIAYAWGRKFLGPQDEVLLTEMEHHSNLVPWQMLSREKGVRLRFVPMTADGRLDVEAAGRIITPKTKLVAFTAASNVLGSLTPVEKITALARANGALSLVDASQWAPHRPMSVSAWNCDFLAFSSHKMLGPTGIGVLYGREELLDAMDPFMGGGDMISRVFLERFTPNVLPHKFEAGTPSIADAVSFGAALDYLTCVGLSRIAAHEESLTRRALELFKAEPGVQVYGPQDTSERGGVISFNIEGVHAHDVGTAFDLEGIAIRAGHHCCQPLMMRLKVPGTARASFYLYNTLEEVEALVAALRKTRDFFLRRAAPVG